MWLPAKLYDRLPYIWLAAGVLFIVAALYMSFAYKWSIWYFGTGVACSVWGMVLFMVRTRRGATAKPDDDPA